MKGTEHFKKTIQAFLEQRAAEDELFAVNYRNPAKNIDDCITYILNYVQKSGCNGFSDEEIFGQVIHFHDEANIEVGKPIDCKVVVNHHVELTEEEKAQARRDAIKRAEDEAYAKLKQQREKATAKRTVTIQQPSLFDF
ncbi:PcfK-like family protein [Bacteroides cellulosilyticus]|uniref:PcfK-like family protein n=1 Tax=Bacteroides cellulosilyticus TaxID=246787 RepID=UPI00101C90C6|nr:PcfK-like family protein [Bacteroides cellulosilyticus]